MERGCPFDEPIFNPEKEASRVSDELIKTIFPMPERQLNPEDKDPLLLIKKNSVYDTDWETYVVSKRIAMEALEILRREHKKELEELIGEVEHYITLKRDFKTVLTTGEKRACEDIFSIIKRYLATKGGTE